MNSLYISICIFSSLACTSNMHKPDACCWMSIHKQRQVVDLEWEREREREGDGLWVAMVWCGRIVWWFIVVYIRLCVCATATMSSTLLFISRSNAVRIAAFTVSLTATMRTASSLYAPLPSMSHPLITQCNHNARNLIN